MVKEVERIIIKEKPDGILLGFGGQTALNCGIELYNSGVLGKYNVKVLGTQVETIIVTEDKGMFAEALGKIDVKVPKSVNASTIDEGIQAANKIGYPVIVRIGYALGGLGSGFCNNEDELNTLLKEALTHSNQILIEESLKGWKEIEYEVMRDSYDNCMTVCNMENFDPLGIHTGESIVIAPSQTLTDNEYQQLRDLSIKVIRHLGIVGECNIQFALDPYSEEYRVIEVNARLSRSSALASKATGYPLAFIAAKLAVGYSLIDIPNPITGTTKTFFEPAMDYVVVKMPRWDHDKFKNVDRVIGSSMKSVGEVMAIGRKFEETLQKAIRMLSIGLHGLVGNNLKFDDIENELRKPTDKRLLVIVEAIKQGIPVEKIHELTKIDKWFLCKIKNVVETESALLKYNIDDVPAELLKISKQAGFSDFQIAKILFNDNKGMEQKMLQVRNLRKKYGILPSVKQIDTLAAEYPAKTNYLYLTYNGDEDDIEFNQKNNIIVLGSGAYRIGSSVEFDWCCVNAVFTLKKLGYSTIMINYNPETVSTDYDVCDGLYFDELSLERVLDIYEKENPIGMVISAGGQIPNNLAMKLHRQNVKILGTSPLGIDNAENRNKFSALLDSLSVDQPEWAEAKSIEEAHKFAEKVEYPVLIRPSYVLSGAAMSIASDKKELELYLQKAADVSKEHPVVISKFIANAKEIEIDAVAQNGNVVIYAISEHIENAGVHSGDATMVLPPQYTYLETIKKIKEATKKIAKALEITGPFNIQFIAKDNQIKVIECNLRASRSFPFVSKVTKYNFIDFATKAMLGMNIRGKYNTLDLDYVGVKAPQFSFARLGGADPVLRVEMASTGEVGCFGETAEEAYLKSLLSTGMSLKNRSALVTIGGAEFKLRFAESIWRLKNLGFKLYATKKTHLFLKTKGVRTKLVYKLYEKQGPTVIDLIKKSQVSLVINLSEDYNNEGSFKKVITDGYLIRRAAIDNNIPLFTDLNSARFFVNSLDRYKIKDLKIKSWDEYL